MDLKLWEYIFEMFNYKIRQKKIDFFKITNPYPALKKNNFVKSLRKQYGNPDSHLFFCSLLTVKKLQAA